MALFQAAVCSAVWGQGGQIKYVFPAAEWQHIAPESAGYSLARLNMAREMLARTATTGLVAVAGGQIVFEYGDLDTVSYIASARKSILSMLYGNYVQRDAIRLGATLEQLGIDDVGGLTGEEKLAQVRDLLTARSGVFHAAATPGDDLDDAPPRGSRKPGTYFLYSNWDFNALGTIFEQRTKHGIFDALEHDIAKPIGMQDFRRELHKREGNVKRSVHLDYQMYFSVRDMARIGYLMLRNGVWNGSQVIPPEWVRESTNAMVPLEEMNPPGRRAEPWGYGYLWWVWDGPATPASYKGAYAARGAFGQNIVVLPVLDLVVVSKVIPGENRDLSAAQFLNILDVIVQARTGGTEHSEVQLPDSILERYVGVYEFSPTATLTITLENSGLFAQLAGQRKAPIFAESLTAFFFRVVDAQIHFTQDPTGAVVGLLLHQSGGRAASAKKRSAK
jgi:CubicO group peptidase (beta-lactamase class C family)